MSVPPAVRAQELALPRQVSDALHSANRGSGRYGAPAGFLPRNSVPAGRILTAAPGRPVLAIEGDTVRLQLPGGQGLLSAAGPAVPDRIQGTRALRTPTRFLLTFTGIHGTLPLPRGAFTIVDELGHLHHPHVSRLGGASVPGQIGGGGRLTLALTGVLPVGNGRLRFAPASGAPVVSWDFDVETD